MSNSSTPSDATPEQKVIRKARPVSACNIIEYENIQQLSNDFGSLVNNQELSDISFKIGLEKWVSNLHLT